MTFRGSSKCEAILHLEKWFKSTLLIVFRFQSLIAQVVNDITSQKCPQSSMIDKYLSEQDILWNTRFCVNHKACSLGNYPLLLLLSAYLFYIVQLAYSS